MATAAVVSLLIGGCIRDARVETVEPAASQADVAADADEATKETEAQDSTLAAGEPVAGYDGTSFKQSFYAPTSIAVRNGRFDLVVHFHGKHQTTIDALDQSGLPAVLVNVFLGEGGTKYRKELQREGALAKIVAFAEREVDRSGRLPGARVGRIALSAWSAGYAATREILSHPTDAARVDALLLVDGFFANWKNRRARTVDESGIAAAVAIAKQAAAGEKLFVLTHTLVDRGTYAGAPATADFVLKSLGVPKRAPAGSAARFGGAATYVADAKDFHIWGFDGVSSADHYAQHRGMGGMHYAALRAYWERGSAPAAKD